MGNYSDADAIFHQPAEKEGKLRIRRHTHICVRVFENITPYHTYIYIYIYPNARYQLLVGRVRMTTRNDLARSAKIHAEFPPGNAQSTLKAVNSSEYQV